MSDKRFYARNGELVPADRPCDCSKPCHLLVDAAEHDAEIATLRRELAEAKAALRWHRVEEGLPPPLQLVACVWSGHELEFAAVDTRGEWYSTANGDLSAPLYWREIGPLPSDEPPKE